MAQAHQKCLMIFSVIVVLVTPAYSTFGFLADIFGGLHGDPSSSTPVQQQVPTSSPRNSATAYPTTIIINGQVVPQEIITYMIKNAIILNQPYINYNGIIINFRQVSGPGPNVIVIDSRYYQVFPGNPVEPPGAQVRRQVRQLIQHQILYFNGQPIVVDEHMISLIKSIISSGGNTIAIENVPFTINVVPGPGPNTISIENRYFQIVPANQG